MAVTDAAIEKIRGMITSGRLRPGDRLPPEAELAAQLGLSRSSLREAVKALSLMNVLDVRQGDGSYVTSLDPGLLLDAMSFAVDFQHDSSVLLFFEVRRMLEPAATALATVRMSDAEVAGLSELLDELPPDPGVEELVANDQEFHRRIARGSGNAVLASLIESVSGRTQRARIWRGLTQSSAVRRTLDEHRAICAAMAARQADVAHACAMVHVAGVEQWLREALGSGLHTPTTVVGDPKIATARTA
jgi:GntR family transcriptional regulator, transcriptional repressor for pyruvate dehydrogenase complex